MDILAFADNPAAGITTLVFICGIILFSALIMARYRSVNRLIQNHLEITDAILTYIEYDREPDPEHKIVFDSFSDYRAVLRDSGGDDDYFIKFKRKNLEMQKVITPRVEFCRTSVETLPFLGLLGTVLGFLMTPDMFSDSFSATTSGLVLALSSTATALFFAILIKLVYESRVIPLYIQFENSLEAIESYGERHGSIEHRRARA